MVHNGNTGSLGVLMMKISNQIFRSATPFANGVSLAVTSPDSPLRGILRKKITQIRRKEIDKTKR